MKKIYWRVLVNSTKPIKVDRIIYSFTSILGEVAINSREIYWKDRSLTDVTISQLSNCSVHETFIRVFSVLQKISDHWYVNFESEDFENDCRLSCIAEQIKIQGIHWVSCDIMD